jgi:hypothetical protein
LKKLPGENVLSLEFISTWIKITIYIYPERNSRLASKNYEEGISDHGDNGATQDN